MQPWTLWQYARVVSEFRALADEEMWAEMYARLVALLREGNRLGWPASEPVGKGTGLFALRAKSGRAQGRLFYFFAMQQRIVFVHAVKAKKTRAFQQHDIDIAARRKQEIERQDDIRRLLTAFTVTDDDQPN